MANAIMQLVATNSSRVRELPFKNGQLIFVQNLGRIAFDFNDKRVFYNQIVELETEIDRKTLEEPLDGYYFVISTGCFWLYKNGWTQITEKPKDILFIDVEIPQLGQEGKLYVNKTKQDISVWDEEFGDYIVVADRTKEVSDEDILSLF